MKKILGVMVVLCMICQSSLFASITRLESMSMTSNNYYDVMEDDALFFSNPAYLVDQEDQVLIEMDSGLTWGGGIKSVGSGLLGVFVNTGYNGRLSYVGDDSTNSTLTNIPTNYNIHVNMWDPSTYPDKKLDLFFGTTAGSMDLGALLEYSHNSSETKRDTKNNTGTVISNQSSERNASELKVTLGAKTDMLDLVFGLGFPMLNNKYKEDDGYRDFQLKGDGMFSLNLGGRVKLDDENLIFVSAQLEDISNEFTRKEDANTDGDYVDAGDTNYKQTRENYFGSLSLGCAKNHQLSDNSLLIASIALKQEYEVENGKTEKFLTAAKGVYEKTEYTGVQFSIPLSLGYETTISNVTTLRFGFTQEFLKIVTSNTDTYSYTLTSGQYVENGKTIYEDTNTELFGDTNVSAGVGFSVTDNFTLDTVVSLDSGATPVSQLSAKYKF